ncbi:MAG TPA: ABC-2 transporter permease [Atopobiaceae bacterium]|nr:ABC-2 transporter permease [Atopobiaceae bacterium]
MKALFYSDLITIAKSLRQFVFSVSIICIMLTLMSIGEEGISGPEVAGAIQTTIMSTGTIMISLFAFFQLFGLDEHAGWESVKLSLPLSRRQVIMSRYIILAALLVAFLVLGIIVGTGIAAIVTYAKFGAVTLRPAQDVLMLAGICLLAVLAYLAIELPLFFKMGLSKARLFYAIPLLSPILFTLEPVKEFVRGLGTQVMEVIGNIGSPWPLLLGAAAVTLALYALSGLVSLRLYSAREF